MRVSVQVHRFVKWKWNSQNPHTSSSRRQKLCLSIGNFPFVALFMTMTISNFSSFSSPFPQLYCINWIPFVDASRAHKRRQSSLSCRLRCRNDKTKKRKHNRRTYIWIEMTNKSEKFAAFIAFNALMHVCCGVSMGSDVIVLSAMVAPRSSRNTAVWHLHFKSMRKARTMRS